MEASVKSFQNGASPRGRGGGRGRGRGRGSSRGHRGGEGMSRGRGGSRGRSPSRGFRGGEGMSRGRGGGRGRSPSRGFRGGEGMSRGRGGGRGRSPFRGHRGEGGRFNGRGGRGRGSSRGGFDGHTRGSESSSGRDKIEQGESNENQEDLQDKGLSSVDSKRSATQRGRGSRTRGRGRGDGKFSKKTKKRPQEVMRKHELVPEETKKAVLITNLPKKVEAVHEDFKDFIEGVVGPVKILFYRKVTLPHVALPTAVCVFEDPSDFNLAVEKLRGKQFLDRHLLVQKFKDCFSNAQLISHNCIHVSNLPEKAIEEELWKIFESCGELGMIHIHHDTCPPSVEALVNFQNPKGVKRALKLNESSSMKIVHLDWALSVFISNLTKNVSPAVMLTLLEGCTVSYMRVESKKKKEKTAFVTFADKESYGKAFALHGTDVKGSKIYVSSTEDYSKRMNLSKGALKKEVKEELDSSEDEEEPDEDHAKIRGQQRIPKDEVSKDSEDSEEESDEDTSNGDDVEAKADVKVEVMEDEDTEDEDEDTEDEEDAESLDEDEQQSEQESDKSMVKIVSGKQSDVKTKMPKQLLNASVPKMESSQISNKRKSKFSGRGFNKIPRRS